MHDIIVAFYLLVWLKVNHWLMLPQITYVISRIQKIIIYRKLHNIHKSHQKDHG